MMNEDRVEFINVATQDGNTRGSLRRRHSWSALADAAAGADDASHSSWAQPRATSPRRTFQPPVGAEQTIFSPQRTRASASRATRTTKQQPPIAPPLPAQSMQDQFMAATLGLLKMAGGATLSTTGKLATPPLYAFRDVFVPALGQMIAHYFQDVTPQRVKDWLRILSSGWDHLWTVIINTSAGTVFRRKLVTVGVGLVDCASSDVSRQAIMDGMATLVKLSEALHTPETKALLDQLSVLGCRMVDVAASGRSKKLLHDVSDTVWSGLEVFSDPATTLAFAEVTAYLCYALEMEDALHHQPSREKAAEHRYQRNMYQKQTYVDPNLTQDGHSTVEQVILSSLGENTSDVASLPSNVAFNPGDGDWLRKEAEAHEKGASWRDNARDEIDLPLLHDRLAMRAAELERQRENRNRAQVEAVGISLQQRQRPQPESQSSQQEDDIEDLIVTTVNEDDDDDESIQETRPAKQPQAATVPPSEVREKTQIDSGLESEKQTDDIDEWIAENPVSLEPLVPAANGEPAHDRFFRRLDEIMMKKRAEAVTDILNAKSVEKDSKVYSWFPRAATAAGAGNERGQDTIKSRIASIQRGAVRNMSEIGVGQMKGAQSVTRGKIEQSRLVSMIYTGLGLVVVFWFILGLYGCYALISSARGTNIAPTRSNVQQEFVVRIVREVVHVSPDGSIIKTGSDPSIISGENADDVAACIAKAMG